jgi:hypothetical protein
MTQPVIPYETPAMPERPACILPISIVGIALAGITLLMRFGGIAVTIVTLVMLKRMAGMPALGASSQVFQIVSSAVFAAFAGLLLAASIGCLRMKEWGRAWLVRYAILYPIAMLLEIAGTIVVVVPATHKMMRTISAAGPPPPPTMNSMITAMTIVWLVVQMIVLMILPVFIFVLLRKPAVRAAFPNSPPAA